MMSECVHIESLDGATDRLVTPLNQIHVTLTYPLKVPYHIYTYGGIGGYTLREFCEMIRNGYREAYRQAEVFQPWGHEMGMLWLEDIREVSPGEFVIDVGS